MFVRYAQKERMLCMQYDERAIATPHGMRRCRLLIGFPGVSSRIVGSPKHIFQRAVGGSGASRQRGDLPVRIFPVFGGGDDLGRVRTKYPNIYFNDQTKKYDVKFNFKEYDPLSGRNRYRSKWRYSCATVSEAKEALKRLQQQDQSPEQSDITLAGIAALWEIQARVNRLRDTSIENTRRQVKAISTIIPGDTKLKNITVDTFNNFVLALRESGKKESTVSNYVACLKKLMRYAYRRGFIRSDIFDQITGCNQARGETKSKDGLSSRLITREEFLLLDQCLQGRGRKHMGVDNHMTFRLLFHLLYYSGLRIGEALALMPKDFQEKRDACRQKNGSEGTDPVIFQVAVTKTAVRNGGLSVREGTKNYRDRFIPLPGKFRELYTAYMRCCEEMGHPVDADARLFPYTPEAVYYALQRYCREAGIRPHSAHDFRHTYISNLVALGLPVSEVAEWSGDSQQTILRTYIHATENYKQRLLETLNKL